MPAATLRIHHIEPSSQVNGPGRRFVTWVQGCTLGCPGCFNPATFPKEGGTEIAVDALIERVFANTNNIEGITISGGEPLQQIIPLTAFLKSIREKSQLSTLVFSGFTWDEIQRIPGSQEFLNTVDVLLAGRFQAKKRVARGLLGSANKTAHFLTNRYSRQDLESIPEAEILISPDGSVTATGIDPLAR